MCISNGLYISDVCSAFEFAQDFTIPIKPGTEPKFVPDDVINARDTLIAKRKLNLILRSKLTSEILVEIGDAVQVFIKLENEKRGNWSNPKPILEYDKPSGTVIVPGTNGHKIKAAVEDVLFAITNDELALKHQQAIDELKASIDELVSESSDKGSN